MNRIVGGLVAYCFLATIPAVGARTTVTATVPSQKMWRLDGGMGLAMVDGTGFHIQLGGAYRVSKTTPLFVGIDTGFDFVHSNTYLPLMATAIYRFEGSTKHNLTPYLGLSLGGHLRLSSGVASTGNAVYDAIAKAASEAATGGGSSFAFVFRPGVDYGFTETLSGAFEAKMGSLDGQFYMVPQASILLSL